MPEVKMEFFVEYDKASPAYLLYFPNTGTVRKIRCVKFTRPSLDVTSDVAWGSEYVRIQTCRTNY